MGCLIQTLPRLQRHHFRSDASDAGTFYYCSTTISVADATLSPADGMNTTIIGGTEAASFYGVVAHFDDANPYASTSDFSASVYFGDSGIPGAVSVEADPSGGFDVVAGNSFLHAGSYFGTVQVADDGGQALEMYLESEVADAPLSLVSSSGITATEGASYTAVVATFTDADSAATASDYSAGIVYGDGTSLVASVVADPSGGFDVIADHTYTEAGTYSGEITVTDDGGSTLSTTLAANVLDAPITASESSNVFAVGQTQTVTVGFFADESPSETGTGFTASIDWGDGNTEAGTIIDGGGGHFYVTGAHAYASAGTFNGSATLVDPGGVTASASYTATSANIDSLTVTNGNDGTQTETTPTSSDTLFMTAPDYSATASISAGISPSGSAAATAAAVYAELDPTGATIASGSLGSGADIPLNWAPYDDGARLTIEAGIQTAAGTTWMQTMQVARQHLTLSYTNNAAAGTGPNNRLQINAGTNQTFQSITALDQNGNASTTAYTITVTSLSPVAIVNNVTVSQSVQGAGTTQFVIAAPPSGATGEYNITLMANDDPSRSTIIYITI